MLNSSNDSAVSAALRHPIPWLFADEMTDEAAEVVETGIALGMSVEVLLNALRAYGAKRVKLAMVDAARDLAQQAGIH